MSKLGVTVLRVAGTWNGEPARADELVELSLEERDGGLRIEVDAPWHGDPPPDAPPGPTWALWDHEVAELFVVGPDERYTELELGPHGHHLLLRLDGRRNPVERLLPLDATWARDGARWRVHAWLPAAVLPTRPWRFNAYAIHGDGPARRYLAWAPVPGPAPDFHRLEHFPAIPGIGGAGCEPGATGSSIRPVPTPE